jgi:exonuclease SbcC
MRFKKIKLQNIRSYGEQEIVFPEGSVLLAGEIGSGKTTILLAIEYALFGLQPGQKGSSLLRNGSNEGGVRLELEIDGKEIIIERGLIRSSKSVVNDYSAITIDGRKEEYSITELKTKVLQLLGYPGEFIKKTNLLYRYTVYTPQEQMKHIILEDPEIRLNIIRHIFGIDKYKKIRENLMTLLSNMKEEGKGIQGEIKSLDEDRNVFASTIAFLETLNIKINERSRELEFDVATRKKVEKEAEELNLKISEKMRFENEIEKAKIMLTSKKEKISSLNKETEDLIRMVEESGKGFDLNEYLEVQGKIAEKRTVIESMNNTLIELTGQIRALEKEENDALEKKDKVFQINFCPTCLQDVSETHKHNILNDTEGKIVVLKKKRMESKVKIDDMKKLIEINRAERNTLEEKKTKLEIQKSKTEYSEKAKTKIMEIHREKETLDKDVSLLIRHINNLKETILQFSKFDNLYKIKNEELKESFKIEKNSEIAVAELRKEKQLVSKEIIELEGAIKKKEISKEKLNRLLEIMDWLSNSFSSLVEYVEKTVLGRVRQEFSQLFNKWVYSLAGESFIVQLDENFTPLIMQEDSEMDYSFLSGGERTSVALAYRLALNQTINSMLSKIKTKEIVILDEPTEGFSEQQINKMRDLFIGLNTKQLIIVSHEQKIEGFVDNIIKLRKEDGLSLIS